MLIANMNTHNVVLLSIDTNTGRLSNTNTINTINTNPYSPQPVHITIIIIINNKIIISFHFLC